MKTLRDNYIKEFFYPIGKNYVGDEIRNAINLNNCIPESLNHSV